MIKYDFSKPDNVVPIKQAFPKHRIPGFKADLFEKGNSPDVDPQYSSDNKKSDKHLVTNKIKVHSSRNKNPTIPTANTNIDSDLANDDECKKESDKGVDDFTIGNSSNKNSDHNHNLPNGGGGQLRGSERMKTLAQKLLQPKPTLGKISSYIFQSRSGCQVCGGWEETKTFEFLHTQYLYNCALQCIFALMSIASAITEYELTVMTPAEDGIYLLTNVRNSTLIEKYNISSKLIDNSERTSRTASWLCLATSICLWVCIIFDYFLSCKILQYSKKLHEDIWKREPRQIIELICALIIFIPHPNPATYGINVTSYCEKFDVNITIPLNAYFTAICLLRLWYPLKFYLVSSIYYDPRTERICEMNSFDTSLFFSMKAIMLSNPYFFDSLLLIGALFICSYSLRIFERELDFTNSVGLGNYYNALWCVFITMATVGYGDYSPGTSFGRLFVIIGCIFGVFLISLLVISVSNILNLKGIEKNIYLVLERVDLMAEKDSLATKLVSKYMKLHRKVKEHPEEKQNERRRDELLKTMFQFKEKCNEIDSTFPPYSNFDNIIDNLIFLEKTVSNFRKKYKSMSKMVEHISKKLILSGQFK